MGKERQYESELIKQAMKEFSSQQTVMLRNWLAGPHAVHDFSEIFRLTKQHHHHQEATSHHSEKKIKLLFCTICGEPT